MQSSSPTTQDDAKRLVGERVAEWIEDGMVLGLGTGSTAAMAIQALGRRIAEEHISVSGIPTSFAAERLAQRHHIPVVNLDDIEEIDLAFDGADEVDPNLNLIKGRGAAHTREKIVASQARRLVILVDETKMVDQLGTRMPLPVEIVPLAVGPVMRVIESLGGRPELRMAARKEGPVVSDQGLWVIDATFDGISDLARVNDTLLGTPGVLDHGLFLDMTTDVLLGKSDGSVEHLQR
ncbi:MAG: ribose-5-phosphate isomerase RpiA [Bacteroidetes bacterium]|nr:ribose-5-phosphate isomerase RpiA [Bacteroidota bacterium]